MNNTKWIATKNEPDITSELKQKKQSFDFGFCIYYVVTTIKTFFSIVA